MLTTVLDSSLPAAVFDIRGVALLIGVTILGKQLRCINDLVDPVSNRATSAFRVSARWIALIATNITGAKS